MHQTRAQAVKRLPIPRKGTKYVARALIDLNNSVPVVIAVRDMLHLARTTKEVKKMIHKKLLKINNREVNDIRDSIRLFNIFEADKIYYLTLTQNGRFAFEESKSKERACKVIGKKMLRGKVEQINLHDGSNILTKEKILPMDTVYLNSQGEITKHIAMSEGKECMVMFGKYSGFKGKVESIEGSKIVLKLKDRNISTKLSKAEVIML